MKFIGVNLLTLLAIISMQAQSLADLAPQFEILDRLEKLKPESIQSTTDNSGAAPRRV